MQLYQDWICNYIRIEYAIISGLNMQS